MLSCLLLQLEGLNFEFSEQRAPKMLASIWPSRDENHGQNGHNFEPGTWNLEPGTWNFEPGTWNGGFSASVGN